MSRWIVARNEKTREWAAYPIPSTAHDEAYFLKRKTLPTWREAYQHALTMARREQLPDDWTPEPVPQSGREPASRQNPTVNR